MGKLRTFVFLAGLGIAVFSAYLWGAHRGEAADAPTIQYGPIGCAVASSQWADCFATMLNTWAPGTTLSATLATRQPVQLVCAGLSANIGTCAASGDRVSVTCPAGCFPGEQVSFSILGDFSTARPPQPGDWSIQHSSTMPANAAAGQTSVRPLAMLGDRARGIDQNATPAQTAEIHYGPIGCAVASPQWADCFATMLNNWTPGTTVSGTLTNYPNVQIVCAGLSANIGNCAASGSTISVTCPAGCFVGEQVSFSLLGDFSRTAPPEPGDWSIQHSSTMPPVAAAGQTPVRPLAMLGGSHPVNGMMSTAAASRSRPAWQKPTWQTKLWSATRSLLRWATPTRD